MRRPSRPGLFAGAALAAPAAALAHVADAQGGAQWWDFIGQPVVCVLMLLSAVLYAAGHGRVYRRARGGRGLHRRQAAAFAAGWLALALAFLSPLDTLAAVLFSAHMVQHELLMLVAAPLLVLGRPLAAWIWALPPGLRLCTGRALHNAVVAGTWERLTSPLSAWALHAVALWAWHVPALFEAALRYPAVHALQHTSFLASALLFWWSVLGQRRRGAASGLAMLSLFTTMVHTTALGALLTLAPGLWYPSYIETTMALGFDPLQDQQLGGLVMWVPGGAAYLVCALAVAAGWLRQRDGGAGNWPVVRAP